MTESQFVPQDIDFEEVYRGESPMGTRMPWDIGRPQPVLVAVVNAGQISGSVLDIGCGLGDNSIFLASRGFQVTGVDGSPTALEQARDRAGDLDIDFQLGDATKLDGLENRFDTVVDSALYHCLTEEQRRLYIDALHRATKPGARLHLFCFSEEVPAELPGPFRISEENLRSTVGRKWTIDSLVPARYDVATTREGFVAMATAFIKDSEVSADVLARMDVNDEGNVRMPIWQLAATRA
jgi:SAM-dependent methyltransferase